ncbi:MAG: excinuclease ABC subunit UvrA [Ignavibacteria bacterium]|nr:excinuclease ABC subunit UvrA [Ignavibacteria bacterium]
MALTTTDRTGKTNSDAKGLYPDPKKFIVIRGARVHNLKSVDIDISKNRLIVFTGVSGSGKSSLVFDTIYAEGQRRYVESLSSYARQFLERINKPDVDFMSGLAPSMAIEQKTQTKNPRSTVGTMTEIYDYLRLLFARIGKTFSPVSGSLVKKDTPESIIDELTSAYGTAPFRVFVMVDVTEQDRKKFAAALNNFRLRGFYKVAAGKELLDLNDTSEEMIAEKVFGARKRKNETSTVRVVIDRFSFDPSDKDSVTRLNDSIELAYIESEGYVVISIDSHDSETLHRFNKYLELDGIRFEEPEPRLFSFNNPYGACEECQGFGKKLDIDMDLVIPDKRKSVSEHAIAAFNTPKHSSNYYDLIHEAGNFGLDVSTPYYRLSENEKRFIYEGGGKYDGIRGFFRKVEAAAAYKLHYRVLMNKYRAYTSCSACGGSRLRKEALYVKVNGKTIFDIVKMKIDEAYEFFKDLRLSDYDRKVSERIMEEIVYRLKYLNDVGLTYLTLDRLANSLSGGESQRINLSTSLGSSLVGSIYVLDEPSIGLHPRDNAKLIAIMKSLRDVGNTVLVVEHDAEMMREADGIVDMGPFAGENGGEVIFNGAYEDILKDDHSLTGRYLSGRSKIEIPKARRLTDARTKYIRITGARANNLKDINVKIPLGMFTCITGVSGSGKSTLINNILYSGLLKHFEGSYSEKIGEHDIIEGYENIDGVEMVDQNPIGKTPRSNPITYIKAFDSIREAFADTPESKRRNHYAGYFSFNIPGGRCETCEGTGVIKIEMQFMADIVLECEDCKGKRYKSEALEIQLKGAEGKTKNISEVLEMTVSEAMRFFKPYTRIVNKLKVLDDVGLGYLRVGQSATTLSGGESQRVKLAYHLTFQEDSKHTLFIFDEPTTGLHFYDVSKLLKCFNELIKKGNSVLVIEHNLEVIKCADYIVDLGPESGDGGGEIVAAGTPEDVAGVKESYTGKFLKEHLK